jgi:hypothetical protein
MTGALYALAEKMRMAKLLNERKHGSKHSQLSWEVSVREERSEGGWGFMGNSFVQ